jgi:hypothetical protein
VPRVFLSLYADSHDAAIEYYCETLGLFAVIVDKRFSPTTRNVVLNYIGAAIPLSLAVVVAQRSDSAEPIRRVFALTLFHPKLDLAYETLRSAGFRAEMEWVPLGREVTTTDPFGNTLYLTEKTYDSYDQEGESE